MAVKLVRHPFARMPDLWDVSLIRLSASGGAARKAYYTLGEAAASEKLLPGSIPMRFMRARMG